jgi:Tfp pilus assembly protein PilW
MTLVEMMIGATVSVIFFMALNSFCIFAQRSFGAMGNYAALEQKSSYALDQMSKDIRQTTRLCQYSTNMLVFTNDFTFITVKYNYSPSTRQLVRIKNEGQASQEQRVLLEECDQLEFGVFQQNPIPTTFIQVAPTNGLSLTKVIQLHWVCSRTIMQARLNTETVQSAKVVMRCLKRDTNDTSISF